MDIAFVGSSLVISILELPSSSLVQEERSHVHPRNHLAASASLDG